MYARSKLISFIYISGMEYVRLSSHWLDPTMNAIFSSLSIILSLLVIIEFFFSFSSKFKKGNLPPSPLSLPFIGHLHLFKKPLHQTLARISGHYGPIFALRFGSRPVLVVSSPALAEECLTKNDIIFANRPQLPTTKYHSYNYTSLATASYGPHWRNMRRIAAIEVFSSHRLNSFNDVRAAEVTGMIRRLFLESSDGGFTRVELKSRLFGLSLNVIMMMVAGKRYYGAETDDVAVHRFMAMVEETFSVAGVSNLHDFLPLLRWVDFQGVLKKVLKLQKLRDEILQGLIDDHRRKSRGDELEEGKKALIGVLLSLQKSDPDYYTDEMIKSFVISLLSAGTDTSSNTIEWAMSLLLNHPTVLTKAQLEIDTNVEKGRMLQESHLSNLPYLHCVITEALRLYPAGPLLVPHESSEECTIGGYRVPRGTMLLVNAYAIQRDPNTWADPEKFVPERFEGAEKVDGGLMLPFGMGRRRCPGEELAMRVVGLELGTMIHCFKWERIGKEEVDMTEGSGLTLPKAVPLEAMYRPRQVMVEVLSGL